MANHIFPEGVITATLTPLHSDLSVDHNALARHINWLLKNGSQGIVLWGTTGEANSFSLGERKVALENLLKHDIPAHRLMVGTGCCALPDTIALTNHAVSLGVGGILMLPPFYYKQITDRGLYQFFDKMIAGVNDRRLRIYLYHFPKMSGISFSPQLIESLVNDFPTEIVGIKDSSGDLDHMKHLLDNFPGFKVFAGTEKLLLDVLRLGGAGCISATANVTIELVARIYNLWTDKLDPGTAQKRASMVRSIFEGLPFTGALKAYLASITNDPDWLNIRPPNTIIGASDFSQLLEETKQAGFSL